MNITAERIPDSQVRLTIEVDPDRVERSMDQAYRRVLPRVRVPGFRPGKAPRRILERHVGREALLHEALEKLVPEVVDEAIKDQGLQAILQPELEIEQLDPVVIRATVPVQPTVDLGTYRNIRIEPRPVTFDEEEVERSLEDLRRRYARTEPVDRPIQDSDRVWLTGRATRAGETVIALGDADNDDEPAPVSVTAEALRLYPGLYGNLLGMATGETRRFTVVVPEDFDRADIAGQEITYEVTVRDVQAENLPELNDDFARTVGEGFTSLDALRERLRANLRERAEAEAKEKFQEEALQTLLAGATIEYPPQLVEREIDRMVEDTARQLGRGDERLVQRYIQLLSEGPANMRDTMREQAIDRVRRALVMTRLAELEGIEVTAEDIDAELHTLTSGSTRPDQIRALFGSETGREVLGRNVKGRRTLDRLTAIVTGQAPPLPTPVAEATAPPEPSAPAVETGDGTERAATGGLADA